MIAQHLLPEGRGHAVKVERLVPKTLWARWGQRAPPFDRRRRRAK